MKAFLTKYNPKRFLTNRYGRVGLAMWLAWEVVCVIRTLIFAPAIYTASRVTAEHFIKAML